MLKILGLLSVMLIVIATAGIGTWAYFSDTETATGNNITAGSLNLKVGDTDGTVTAFDISASKKKPGDAGTHTWQVQNIGDVSATLKITIGAITNNENTRYSMETAAGDTTSGDTEGELGSLLKIAFLFDLDKDGKIDAGESYLKSDGTVVAWAGADDTTFDITGAAAAFDIVNNYGSDVFSSVATLAAASDDQFVISWVFPDAGDSSDNKAQTDDVEFDITWYVQ